LRPGVVTFSSTIERRTDLILIYWKAFEHQGETHSLDHLHPMSWKLNQEAKGTNPQRIYNIEITFSMHAFTRSIDHSQIDESLHYSDKKETRHFCFERYELSKQLPAIIQSLDKGYVFHTGRQNFMRIDIADAKYEIYFVVRRSAKADFDLDIYIQSAYQRTYGNSPRAGKIKFYVVAHNTLHNKPIKPHKR
jgi:hypothetical protein